MGGMVGESLKGADGSGSSTRNPRPRKRAGKRAHTCPPSDPRYLLTFPHSHHHFAPFGPNKTGKAFVKIKRKKKRVKREKKLGKEMKGSNGVSPISLSKN